MKEEWRDIEGWPYQVSNLGRVRRVHLMNPIITKKGYRRVLLSRGRNRHKKVSDAERMFFVHRLVAEAFLGPCPCDKSQIAHKDGNPQNNTISNLYWATPKENARDRISHGNYSDGERHFASKCSNDTARLIRAWYHVGGDGIAAISRRFMVSEHVVANIVKGRTYKSAGGYGL